MESQLNAEMFIEDKFLGVRQGISFSKISPDNSEILLVISSVEHSVLSWVLYLAKNNSSWILLSSVQFSHSVMSDSLRPHEFQHARPPCPSRQASLSITNSHSLLKLMSIESVMKSTHLILCHTLVLLPSIFPSIRVFLKDPEFTSGGQSIGVSASASVLPMNIQDWLLLGLNGWISWQSKGLSRVFYNKISQTGFFPYTDRILKQLYCNHVPGC